jgi:hypothetical protein
MMRPLDTSSSVSVIIAHAAHGSAGHDAPAAGPPLVPGVASIAWRTAAAALQHPQETPALEDEEFAALVSLLEEQRALPLFVRAVRGSPAWADLGEGRRTELAQRCRPYLVASMLAVEEVANVVSTLVTGGLHPVVLKGPALALRFYAEPYLRSFVDIDLLFTARREAEEAYALLQAAGYVAQEQVRGGDPWLWSRHLPELRHSERLLRVECHGGLVFPPRDRRHARERVLLADLDELELGACCAQALSPEASVISAFAHAFVRHAGEALPLTVLLDADAIIRKQGGSFRWKRLTGLAEEAGFAPATAAGLEACGEFLGLQVPDSVVDWCRGALADAPLGFAPGSLQRVRSAGHLSGILHADTLCGAVSMVFFSTFPTPAFMRWRYRDKARWPLVMLYPYRWTIQAGKATLLGRAAWRDHGGLRG